MALPRILLGDVRRHQPKGWEKGGAGMNLASVLRSRSVAVHRRREQERKFPAYPERKKE
jgi:hypothetical protein